MPAGRNRVQTSDEKAVERVRQQDKNNETVKQFLSKWRKCDRNDVVRIDISAPSLGYTEFAELPLYGPDLSHDNETVLLHLLTLIEFEREFPDETTPDAGADAVESELGARLKCKVLAQSLQDARVELASMQKTMNDMVRNLRLSRGGLLKEE